jgi:hypothetical protein
MGNMGTTCYVILGIVIVLGAVIRYARIALIRKIRNRHLLQDFFGQLSRNHEKAWTTHYQDAVAKATIARGINTKIRENMGKNFQILFSHICFPGKSFVFFTDHPETNTYITTMYAEFRTLYKDHKNFGAGENALEEDFYKKSEKVILAELEKTQ